MSFLVHELTSSRVDEFVSFSKACEQRCYLHTIDRLLHYFSAFISMLQQRQLSNHVLICQLTQPHRSNRATSLANLRNDTCRIMQRHMSTCVAPAADSRFE